MYDEVLASTRPTRSPRPSYCLAISACSDTGPGTGSVVAVGLAVGEPVADGLASALVSAAVVVVGGEAEEPSDPVQPVRASARTTRGTVRRRRAVMPSILTSRPGCRPGRRRGTMAA